MALPLFLDRDLGSRLVPEGLRTAGWAVTTMDERYGTDASQSVKDEDWIQDAASRGELLVCKDRNVAKRRLEAQAIYYSSARVLVIASASISGPEMLARLLRNADAISAPEPRGARGSSASTNTASARSG
ncbi:hypothetical protein [Leifsonia sp. WHRI 6310E]|uniref:PIN-like domain-containing protein n=1 Tax=Leifsonia sp. WHRI 6310E TaxID=3162562 RepID=UPI0032EBC04A